MEAWLVYNKGCFVCFNTVLLGSGALSDRLTEIILTPTLSTLLLLFVPLALPYSVCSLLLLRVNVTGAFVLYSTQGLFISLSSCPSSNELIILCNFVVWSSPSHFYKQFFTSAPGCSTWKQKQRGNLHPSIICTAWGCWGSWSQSQLILGDSWGTPLTVHQCIAIPSFIHSYMYVQFNVLFHCFVEVTQTVIAYRMIVALDTLFIWLK